MVWNGFSSPAFACFNVKSPPCVSSLRCTCPAWSGDLGGAARPPHRAATRYCVTAMHRGLRFAASRPVLTGCHPSASFLVHLVGPMTGFYMQNVIKCICRQTSSLVKRTLYGTHCSSPCEIINAWAIWLACVAASVLHLRQQRKQFPTFSIMTRCSRICLIISFWAGCREESTKNNHKR
jgi:hypothetical protein